MAALASTHEMHDERDLRRRGRNIIARWLVGIGTFWLLPGFVILIATGTWYGFLISPALTVALGVFLFFMLLVEWVFGVSPADFMEQERQARK